MSVDGRGTLGQLGSEDDATTTPAPDEAPTPAQVPPQDAGAAADPAQVGGAPSIQIRFTGAKSPNNLKAFKKPACEPKLGLSDCSAKTLFWVWNVEGMADVDQDVDQWKLAGSFTGRKKGMALGADGKSKPFDIQLNVPNDDPFEEVIWRDSMMRQVLWLDAPGHGIKLETGERVDSMISVQNFVSKACRKGTCATREWFVKLVIKPGAILDTKASNAGHGKASTTF